MNTTEIRKTLADGGIVLGNEVHVNAGNHDLIAVVDAQSAVRVHQEIELAADLDKMHLFEKDAPNLNAFLTGDSTKR